MRVDTRVRLDPSNCGHTAMSSTADFRWCYLFDARALTHRFEQVDVRGLKPKVGVQGLGPLVVPEDVQCDSRQAQLLTSFSKARKARDA